MRTTLTLLLAFSLLSFVAAPVEATSLGTTPPDYTCADGFLGDAACAVLGLTCEVIVFLLGPGSCFE